MSPSARMLLLANVATLAAALVFDWPAGWLLWPYWMQSVVIGWYARKRMLSLHNFSTSGFTSNNRAVPEDEAGKRSTANFFTLHYGFFHLGYFVFLCAQHPLHAGWDLIVLAACGVSFVLSQRQTYAAQHAADLRGRPNLGTLMFTPYLRVIPMHLAILLGAAFGASTGLMVLFTALKTLSDLGLDAIDRRMAVRGAERTTVVVE
ncbi:DUF6498-containing protein [Lysobacter sp. A6]|uniref:DUF6498-containing protein n=1 Tax=Noviluteimonas lactosilytica TaxID=2888523 RepID=A0ABS8JKI7_9GAMM|nr:DUF6498-containing protein [Lysobacter lactosilyticus]MCC8364127.1 DUF6498-containing protein [Lysobacter lactosilyticus]